MKKIITTLVILLLSITLLNAQQEDISDQQEFELINTQLEESEVAHNEDENSVSSRNQYFDLELVKVRQSPLNKEILFRLYIKPKIDSPRTQIIWDAPSSLEITKKHSEFLSFKKDTIYTLEATIKPNKAGLFNVAATAISWQYDTNRTNSVNYNLDVNNSLIAQPVAIQYTLTLILFILGIVLLTAGIIFGIVKGLKVLIKKFKKWITPPL